MTGPAGGRVKYPRTPHLPWSPGRDADDVGIRTLAAVESAEVVVTEKLDGECTTIGPGGWSHARSLDSGPHPSRTYVRSVAGRIGHLLPPTMRVCGENVYAVHSVEYTGLADHFQVFNIWDGDRCLSWDETVEWAHLLDLVVVPVLHRGPWPGPDALTSTWRAATSGRVSEGYVVRTAAGFDAAAFTAHVAKYVRPAHVQTDEHWLDQEMRVNGLRAPATSAEAPGL
ncbi:RNA ligase family protein [Kineosporia sp. A_224]|uniref:RNA ligase family protein n=1 Tax=Kineosporia sp. A_224 TaxID=1962180 RepID=UPI000B4AACDE|nr:RNA ligase family protein [Kineosporia sp. A_224]